MQTLDVLRAKSAPLEVVITPKSGSRFLMNLMHYLNTGEYYPEPNEIEQSDALKWARAKALRTHQKTIRIALVRHPLNRFAAFYFENIYARTYGEEHNWIQRLKQMGLNFDAGKDVEKHQKNAGLVVDLIEEKVERHGLYSVAADIAPQVKFVLPAQDIGFEPLVYGRANIELAIRLENHLKDAQTVTTKIMSDLTTPWPVPNKELMRGTLAKRLEEIYAIDLDFFEAIRYGTT